MKEWGYSGTINSDPVVINVGFARGFQLTVDEGSETGSIDVSFKAPDADEDTTVSSGTLTLGTNAGINSGTALLSIEEITLTPDTLSDAVTYHLRLWK